MNGRVVNFETSLYHFTNKDAAIEHILSMNRLRFSRLTDSHDPYEYKRPNMLAQNRDEIYNFVQNNSKIICFSKKSENKHVSHSRMWSQYASGHSGVCLVFNRDAIQEAMAEQFNDCKWFMDDVKYKDIPYKSRSFCFGDRSPNKAAEFNVAEFVERHHQDFFFLKNEDYRDEREVRLLLLDKDNSVRYLDITNSLDAVVLGDACHTAYYNIFKQYCRDKSIFLYKVDYRGGEHHITKHNVD